MSAHLNEVNKPGNVCMICGQPQSKNPHPDAGKPEHIMVVGAPYECIPCLVNSRHTWAQRANAVESQLKGLIESF